MTSLEGTIVRQRLARVITHRIGPSTDAGTVAAAARLTHDDLVATLAPLISSGGVEALWGRAFDLAQREFPVGERGDDVSTVDDPFARVSVWLDRQDPAAAVDAAVGVFATFAELLTTLIGGSLTTRYLGKAWPDGFPDAPPTRKKS